ncbi:cytochrome P450 [Striga asiatica]|uniref:Cytochrome P450 n=1 Tax=Striga asiatica TaxID=4170 RepID=A0A5A7QRN0_STRAF|nr:cytochrome P450 [Striga asiatica]
MVKNNNKPPLLLAPHYKVQSFYSVLSRTASIPVLCDKVALGWDHGWLVLVDSKKKDYCLWNPRLMDHWALYTNCVLSGPPTEPGCHILFNGPGHMKQKTLDCSVPLEKRNWITWYENYIMESPLLAAGELLLVTRLKLYRKRAVGRAECEELDGIGEHTIFSSHHGNGYSTGTLLQPNSIYYTDMTRMIIYVYDLEMGSIRTNPLPTPNAGIAVNNWVGPTDILEPLDL